MQVRPGSSRCRSLADDRAEDCRTRDRPRRPLEHSVFSSNCLIPKPTPRHVNVDRPCDAVEQAVGGTDNPAIARLSPRPLGCEPRVSCGRQVSGRDAVGDRVDHPSDEPADVEQHVGGDGGTKAAGPGAACADVSERRHR